MAKKVARKTKALTRKSTQDLVVMSPTPKPKRRRRYKKTFLKLVVARIDFDRKLSAINEVASSLEKALKPRFPIAEPQNRS
jgi:hypothetical protein